jgi:hypothetical protein
LKKYSLRASWLKKLLPPRPALTQRFGIACVAASAATLLGFIIGSGTLQGFIGTAHPGAQVAHAADAAEPGT